MADNYSKLTETEKAYWDVYARLRELSDWDGFTDAQRNAKDSARSWLQNQRKQIWRAAGGDDGNGWDELHRRERYEQLKDSSLNTASCRRVCQLPTNGGTPTEKARISEREMWWRVNSVDDQTKRWREFNAGQLVARRQELYSLGQSDGWDKADRRLRYRNLCIATKHGDAYKAWARTHNDTTGESTPAAGDASSRAKAVSRARSFLGVTESPSGSNRGTPQPSGWQRRVIGATGYAWCACFTTCMAWDAGVVGGSSAGVVVIMDMAQRGVGMFRGWTTDPSKARRGDMLIIGCTSCHVGMIAETPGSSTTIKTIEGNTRPQSGAGSDYNGGGVFHRTRTRGEWVGIALVDYPD